MSSEKIVKYIYQLPYPERRELQQLLDADGKWEDLGGLHMHVDPIKLSLIGQAIFSRESPTNLLLEEFGQRNGTIDELFIMLNNMEHYRAMRIIVGYVNPNFHHLLPDRGPVASPFLIPNSKFASIHPSAPNQSEVKGATAMTGTTQEEAAGAAPKFEADSSNFNRPLSQQVTLPSKLSPSLSPSNGAANKPAAVQKLSSFLQESKTYNISEGTGQQYSLPKDQKGKISNGIKKLNIPVAMPVTDDTSIQKSPKFEDDLPAVMKISHKDILKATDSFNESRILGQGGFGIVYKGDWKGISVAIKRLLPKNSADARNTLAQEISLKQSYTEMKILNNCRIDNILPLYGFSLDGPEPCIVYQYMSNGSLEDRLLCKSGTLPLTWLQRSVIADGTAKGLNYLHTHPEKPLVHGDIKSANILLDSDMKAKIGDFGLAREGPASQYTHVKVSSIHGTKVYLPPEYLRNSQLSPKVDVFSYGIVLLEVATGQRALNEKRSKNKLLADYVADMDEIGQLESLRDPKGGDEGTEWFSEILKIGIKCSQKMKSKRPDMIEVLKFFEQARITIETAARIRRLSKEMAERPISPEMSPMELQLWYDIRNGPVFSKPPPNFPNYNQVPLNFSPPPTYSSFHASEIREPPSEIEPKTSLSPIYDQESSCAATAGSCSYGVVGVNSIPQTSETTGDPDANLANSSSSDSIVPYLTILGTKPAAVATISDDLGPTPHPSGILSGIPLKTDDSDIIVSHKLTCSGLNLGDSDSDSETYDLEKGTKV